MQLDNRADGAGPQWFSVADRAGFSRLYDLIGPKLLNYLVANGMGYQTACDVVQETFLRVWKRRDELIDDLAQVSGFIFTVARNYRADLHRKFGRETLQEEITDADYERSGADGAARRDALPVEQIERDDERARLKAKIDAALATLPPVLRETFTLFQIGELSIREIARQTNASETNVKVRIHRAKEKLRAILADELSAKDENSGDKS